MRAGPYHSKWHAQMITLEQFRRVADTLVSAGRHDMARRAARAYKQRLARIEEEFTP